MELMPLFADAAPLPWNVRLPLSVMNFLEFAVWGAWWVVLGQYLNALKFSRTQIGMIYSTMPLGTIVAPIFAGYVADKYFNAEHIMAILHLVGAVLLLAMAFTKKFLPFFILALLYAVVYSPTLGLANGIVFGNINDAERDFPMIRVLGTIGLIASNLALVTLLKPGESVNNRPLIMAAVLSVVLGAFSFYLPTTPPPPPEKVNPFPFLDAIGLLKEQTFAVFFGVAFLITIALSFYYSFTSLFLEQKVGVKSNHVGPLMTIGQWSEIIFLAGIPTSLAAITGTGEGANDPWFLGLSWFLKRYGIWMVLVIGMAAWGVRYAIFTLGRPFPLILLGLALHGICFDFFFAAGFIYVEQTAQPKIRQSAQALFTALTYGVGMYLGSVASGLANQYTTHETYGAGGEPVRETNWSKFWAIPAAGVAVSLGLFLALSRPPAAAQPAPTGENAGIRRTAVGGQS